MNTEALRSIAENRWTAPIRVDISLSMLDCSSRLSATVRARCYDKIRRVLHTVPQRIRGYFSDLDLVVPEIHLQIQDLDSILTGFSASDILAVCEAVERAAVDAGIDRVRLLEVDVSGGARHAHDVSMIPDLLRSCPSSELVLQIGSSATGANARELYATALILRLDEFKPEMGSRLILACNTAWNQTIIACTEDEIDINVSFSVWPLLDGVRGELPINACFTDRVLALGFVGEKILGIGNTHLRALVRTLEQSDIRSRSARVYLSINAPGEGPGASAIWAGFPFSSNADASSNRAAAAFLRRGLTGNIASRQPGIVEADGFPLTCSIRNIHAVSGQIMPANLAGYLVRLFCDEVDHGTGRYVRIISSTNSTAQTGASLDDIPGTIPFADESGWSPSQFVNGGTLLPPSSPIS